MKKNMVNSTYSQLWAIFRGQLFDLSAVALLLILYWPHHDILTQHIHHHDDSIEFMITSQVCIFQCWLICHW